MRPAAALLSLAALAAVVLAVALVPLSRPAAPAPEQKVRLAVLLVFDQLRGDYLSRWRPLFRPDGFARLQTEGAWFTHCYYPYAGTITGPGHASILTGTCPDVHGIVSNNWQENRNGVYCAGHPKYQLVPPFPQFPTDPGDKEKPKEAPKYAGTPEHLRSETVSDVLKEAHGARAKVFGLSIKDRSAILPTGRRPDGAFWFYGVFGTSTYYADAVPGWVTDFNRTKFAEQWFGRSWTRFRPDVDYDRWAGPDDQFGEGKGIGQGITFPHPTTGGKKLRGQKYYEAVVNSPFGNELLLEFAKRCVVAEKLGADDTPDLLVVSFSSNDVVGHTWGPDSHEVLDMTLRTDALVADWLSFLDGRVGRGRYLVAVTADHGVCPLPQKVAQEEPTRKGATAQAGRVDPTELRNELDAHLTATFPTAKPAKGKTAKWVEAVSYPWIHLNPNVVKVSGQTREAVADEAARFLQSRPGVARAITRATLSGPIPESDHIATLAKRSYYPSRCGDLYLVPEPYHLFSAKLATGTSHGTPYNYDRNVPLLVYGPGIRGGARSEPTTPQAAASIFAKWLDLRRPKDAEFPVPRTLGN